MKQNILLLLLLTTTISFSQKNSKLNKDKKHEVKINSLAIIAFDWLDVSYEYLINENSSFGVGVLFSFDEASVFDNYKTLSVTPFYRHYISKKIRKEGRNTNG